MANFDVKSKDVQALYYARANGRGQEVLDRLPYNLVTYNVAESTEFSGIEPLPLVNPGDLMSGETITKVNVLQGPPYETQAFNAVPIS